MTRPFCVGPGSSPETFTTRTMDVSELPDFSAGDAQFLDPNPRRHVQIRPFLASEWRDLHPDYRMLVLQVGGEVLFRIRVRVQPHRRENTPWNVEMAMKQLDKFDAVIAQTLRDLAFHLRSVGGASA